MRINKPYCNIGELAVVIPVFPLPGAVVLPRGQLPLNIFEPRYVAMFDDALKSQRLIGMIQPAEGASMAANVPSLRRVGCVARITQFAETGDGRYLTTLTGVARFRVIEELSVLTLYRQCRVSYDEFAADLQPRADEEQVDRKRVIEALRKFAEARKLNIAWNEIDRAHNEMLVNALAMISPFGPNDKQALLEAPDLKQRAEVLVAITEIELARASDAPTSLQ
jgi:Lon protease-like protein